MRLGQSGYRGDRGAPRPAKHGVTLDRQPARAERGFIFLPAEALVVASRQIIDAAAADRQFPRLLRDR